VTVTLGRVDHAEEDDPDLTISSMDLSLADPVRRALTIGALLPFAERLAAAQGIPTREASEFLVRLSEKSGDPATLTVNDEAVTAIRHEVPALGYWVVTAVDSNYAVCVAGRRQMRLPGLKAADMKVWEEPILQQVAEMARRAPE